ncbi:GNAT family N-acetyltransferase [Halohasta salina]|uniref:GNAT family N-acetyltransferase n=1 Tax=Halohasta salina TaxID=2961621 RepID=UPI0020A4DDFA|nr:GNAT family N-acetyltransferase [Halohasta salina]
MVLDITSVDDPDAWNELVERSPQATPFHRAESLGVMADYADARLHPYVGYKGQEPVGIFPLFELSKGPVTAAFSPPPKQKISYLGPALVTLNGKQRRREKTNSRFIAACLDELDATVDPSFVHLRTATGYTDSRPFVWAGFEPTTRYTYEVDLDRSEDDLLAAFSSDARSNITGTDADAYEISRGGVVEIRRTIRRLQQRHAEQDVAFEITPEFVVDLWRELPDDVFRIYACHRGDRFVGGHITLETGDTVYGWQSWGDMDAPIPVNDLLDWAIISSARERGLERYDLVGANNERISKYKAKFAPELRTYQTLQRGTPVLTLAAEVYKRIQ